MSVRMAESSCAVTESCAIDPALAAVSHGSGNVPSVSLSGDGPEISSSSKFRHGGPRANSGGPRVNSGGSRVNSGGARVNAGGSRPGAGRKPSDGQRAIQSKPLGLRWYVVEMPSGAEKRVMDKIAGGEERVGFEPRPKFETFVPMTKAVKTRRGKRVIEDLPMIEGYGFVRFDAVRDNWTPILRCKSVVTLFKTRGGRPIPLSDQDVLRLRKSSDRKLGLNPLAMPVREKGTMLRVADGPFTSFHAICLECDGINTRALVSIFGRDTPVLLPWESFEAI